MWAGFSQQYYGWLGQPRHGQKRAEIGICCNYRSRVDSGSVDHFGVGRVAEAAVLNVDSVMPAFGENSRKFRR
jgi:hypothetical protein